MSASHAVVAPSETSSGGETARDLETVPDVETVSDVETVPDVETAIGDLQTHLNLIFARTRTLWRESAARVAPDLQVGGYKLLTFIERAGTASAHELAERFEIDKSVISRQVRMLEELGLLESRPDERDGRLRVLRATPTACTALAELRRDHSLRLHAVMAELSPDEIRAASKVFRLLSEV